MKYYRDVFLRTPSRPTDHCPVFDMINLRPLLTRTRFADQSQNRYIVVSHAWLILRLSTLYLLEVGTESISPLYWAIETGSSQVAKAVFTRVPVRLFPKQCGNTWGSYGNGKRPGWLDRGGGRVAHRFHRYFRGFVLACSFRLWIFVVFGCLRPAWTGFVCKFS